MNRITIQKFSLNQIVVINIIFMVKMKKIDVKIIKAILNRDKKDFIWFMNL